MPTTTITLLISPVQSRNVPPPNNMLGNMRVSTDDLTQINGNAGLSGQHSGFCFRVRMPNWWLCQAGYILPGIPGTPFPNGGQIEARGLLDFTPGASPGVVAITGGTGDYRSASGEVHFLDATHWQLIIVTP